MILFNGDLNEIQEDRINRLADIEDFPFCEDFFDPFKGEDFSDIQLPDETL